MVTLYGSTALGKANTPRFQLLVDKKAEAQNIMKQRTEDNINSVTMTKAASRTFAANKQHKCTYKPAATAKISSSTSCILSKENNRIWERRIFKEKSPTQRAKIVAEAKVCFSCLSGKYMFRLCPNPRKCRKDGCNSSCNTLLHWAKRIYPSKSPSTNINNNHNAGARQNNPSNEQSSSKTTTSSSALLWKASIRWPNCSWQVLRVRIPRLYFCAIALAVNLGCPIVLLIDLVCPVTIRLKLTVKGINTLEVIDTKPV